MTEEFNKCKYYISGNLFLIDKHTQCMCIHKVFSTLKPINCHKFFPFQEQKTCSGGYSLSNSNHMHTFQEAIFSACTTVPIPTHCQLSSNLQKPNLS